MRPSTLIGIALTITVAVIVGHFIQAAFASLQGVL